MPIPVFWSGFLCMEQVINEKKIFRDIYEIKPKQEDCLIVEEELKLISIGQKTAVSVNTCERLATPPALYAYLKL